MSTYPLALLGWHISYRVGHSKLLGIELESIVEILRSYTTECLSAGSMAKSSDWAFSAITMGNVHKAGPADTAKVSHTIGP
jgi:hypothetical protein